jgi:hypothetical protein
VEPNELLHRELLMTENEKIGKRELNHGSFLNQRLSTRKSGEVVRVIA